MILTFYSHSTYLISFENTNILVDPFFTDNPTFINKFDLVNQYLLNINPDYILITHAHYDHVSDVENFAIRKKTLIISNYEIANYYSNKGFKTYGLNYGSFINFNFGYIKYVFASHSSSFKDNTYGGNPGGFILKTKKGNIYLAGDTALTKEMKLIPLFINLDLAVLPIGGHFTMDFIEAEIASNFIKCNKILGVHYDTFNSIKINHNDAKKLFLNKNKELILLKTGEHIKLNQ
ncbi:MAG: metal-dependent hydrolase [Candidatus Bostrichicola ureolyticus]|nr:MAG: metal-dependent hydrolase [Candidatus Bostrichicola ureolyticus]